MQPATRDTALSVRGLEVSFSGPFGPFVGRRRAALRGVDLDLARGRLLGLVGPNGSGKTTLLRAAAGLERARAGSVEVLGGTPADAAVRRRVGFLSEVSPFPPELSAPAALDLFASLSGLPRAERRRRVPAWLERVGLRDAGRRALGRFSKGMLRRFGLAQALVHAPDLVLLDEPTAGLDALGLVLFGELVDEALARGAAVVVASHVLGDVSDRADELVVLIDGGVAARGGPAELVRDARRVRLELEGAGPDLLDRIEALAAESGARVARRGPGAGALLELYRRARERAPAPERGA